MDQDENESDHWFYEMTRHENYFFCCIFQTNKGPFTNTCKGGPDAKKFKRKKFSGPPPLLDLTIFRGPPFLPRKIGVNPTENHIDSLFRGKISVFFFSGPPFSGLQNFQGPLFASGPPLQVFVNGP